MNSTTKPISYSRPPLILPFLVLVAGTILFRYTDLDLAACRPFYDSYWHTWGGKDIGVLLFLYDWGEWVVLIPALAGLYFLCGGRALVAGWMPRWKIGLFLILSLVLCHILINPILKEYFDRPRPRHLKEFYETREFHPVLTPGDSTTGSSFPSGHAAAGFTILALYFCFRDTRPKIAGYFALAGIVAGTAIGATRITQGGHYPSDILWSFGLVYFLNFLLYYFWLMKTDRTMKTTEGAPEKSESILAKSPYVRSGK